MIEVTYCTTHRAPWFEDVCDLALQYPDGRECVEGVQYIEEEVSQ